MTRDLEILILDIELEICIKHCTTRVPAKDPPGQVRVVKLRSSQKKFLVDRSYSSSLSPGKISRLLQQKVF